MPDTGNGGLLAPCRWWDVASFGVSRDVYHVSQPGAANRLTGLVSLLIKVAAPVGFVLFLRERRNSSGPTPSGGTTAG